MNVREECVRRKMEKINFALDERIILKIYKYTVNMNAWKLPGGDRNGLGAKFSKKENLGRVSM